MPIKGVNKAKANTQKVFGKISGKLTEETLMQVLLTGESNAAQLTPVAETSFLINSIYHDIRKIPSGYVGRVGYTAEYAVYVHNAPGTLKGQPRSSVSSFETADGKTGFASDSGKFWDPNAEPEFLKKGFERDGINDIKQIISKNYKL